MAQDTKTPKGVLRNKIEEIRRAAEERSAKRKAEKAGLPYLDITKSPINIEALGLVAEKDAQKAKLAVIESRQKRVAVAVLDPESAETKKIIEGLQKQGLEVKLSVSSLSSLEHAWDFYQFVVPPGKEITGRVQIEAGRLEELSKKLITLKLLEEEIINFKSPYTSLIFEIILAGALANRASDIHLEAAKDSGRFRLRIDGLLQDVVENLNITIYRSLMSRIKLLSGLKLNIHDQAQDGRFTIGAGKKEIEIRTSVIPAEFGETIVMRILDPETIHLELSDLGLRADDLEIVKDELAQPNGMILNTGPTGSGKTTTLYSFLQTVYKSEIKVITIEDPIEYHLPGIEQTQVDPEAGYSFSNGLRSILRQDPDVILVGEIRDLETTEIAMHASLTGHLVFSTLHTNAAAGAIPRLIDLGAKSSIIAPAINLIIAQRLVRRLCEHCKEERKMDGELEKKIKKFIDALPARVDRSAFKTIKLFKPKGCAKCGGIGYRGRIGVFELFKISQEIEQAITGESTEVELEKLAQDQGMVTMQEDGIITVLKGRSTLEEVERITGRIKWS